VQNPNAQGKSHNPNMEMPPLRSQNDKELETEEMNEQKQTYERFCRACGQITTAFYHCGQRTGLVKQGTISDKAVIIDGRKKE
jgi:hypothetical protein